MLFLELKLLLLPLPLKTATSSNLLVNRKRKWQSFFKPATSSNLSLNRLEEVAGFRGSGSWIPEVAACTLLTRYIRENVKIATFSRLSGISAFKQVTEK